MVSATCDCSGAAPGGEDFDSLVKRGESAGEQGLALGVDVVYAR